MHLKYKWMHKSLNMWVTKEMHLKYFVIKYYFSKMSTLTMLNDPSRIPTSIYYLIGLVEFLIKHHIL